MPNSSKSPDDGSAWRVARRFLLFALPLGVALLLLEWMMAVVPNSYSAKRDQLRVLAPQIDTLVVGSSQANFGIIPTHLPGFAYNLANTSETLYYTDRLLVDVVPTLPKLKRVIFLVGYLSPYFRSKRGGWEDSRMYYYQREWHIPPEFPGDRYDPRMWSRVILTDWHLIYDSLRQAVTTVRQGGKFHGFSGTDERGWTARIGRVNQSPEAAAVALDRHRSLMRPEDVPANLAALDHALAFLRQKNIQIELITMPVWTTYAQGMNPEYWTLANNAYQDLAKKYGARYTSFLHLPQLSAAEFYDPDHLNPEGAAHFTDILGARLETPP